jgi:hypothetical protein
MYTNIIAWTGLAMLLVLCLPVASLQKLLLTVYGWTLRLALVALIVGAGYLWFRPAQAPVEVTESLQHFPWAKSWLPEPGTPVFGICAVGLISIVLLPLLAVFDLCRRSVIRRVEHVTTIVDQPAPAPRNASLPPAAPQPINQAPRRFGRRAAADAMAQTSPSNGA